MKILHVSPSFGLGGMEKITCSIINHLDQYYNHYLISIDGSDEALQWIKPNNISKIDFHKDRDFRIFLRRMYRAIKTLSPDVMMTYNWGATDAIWIGKILGVQSIIHNEHGYTIEESIKTLWKRDICRAIFYHMASVIVTVSSELKSTLHKKYWLNDKHIQMIPNGIDSSYYSPDYAVRRRVRQELNVATDDYVIVFSGRLDPVKNLEVLLTIFARCQSIDSQIKLLIIGDGPEKKKVESLCHQKHIQNNVVLVGQQVEVLPYLRAGDVFLLTSLTEQMPLTILEAMSVGLPVIASDVGEIGQIIEDGKDGYLRDLNQGWEAFVLALLRLKDPVERRAMSQAARARILNGFQETMMVRRYQDLIEHLLHQP